MRCVLSYFVSTRTCTCSVCTGALNPTLPRTVVVSGYFNPIHRGHLEYFERARELVGPQGRLVVIVNNDHQAHLKKGYSALDEEERVAIVRALRGVDEVVLSIDKDRSVCATLAMMCTTRQPGNGRPDIFANGGDQSNSSIPEAAVCIEHGVKLVDGLGAKVQSSSAIIAHIARVSSSDSSSISPVNSIL